MLFRSGNNNTYCQDNSLSWINWDNLKTYKEFYAFVKELIFFRKKHLIFHMEKELRLMDTLACGFPDLSYHGEDAWRPITSYYNRTIGLMYCCKYEELTNSSALDMKLIYVAYNLHWEMHHLALPKLPTGFLWRKVMDTQEENSFLDKRERITENTIILDPKIGRAHV